MMEVDAISVCMECGRFFGPGPVVMSPQPTVKEISARSDAQGWPEPFTCGECEGRTADGRRQMAEVRRQTSAGGQRCRSTDGLRLKARGSSGIDRSCPPEREDENSKFKIQNSNAEIVGSSQKEFKAAVDTSGAVGKLFEYFRAHYGEWIPMLTLKAVAEIEVPHSRIPEVRSLLPADHDIDQENRLYEPTGKAHSHYRLCLKSESRRLAREAERAKAKGQAEFLATE